MGKLLISLFVIFFFTQNYSQSDSTQEKESGFPIIMVSSGIQSSKNIEPNRPWLIDWRNSEEGLVFSIYLMNMNDKLVDVLVSSTKRMGEAYSNKTGKFYLKIVGMGDWIVMAHYQDVIEKNE